jgi:transposase
MQSLPDLNSLSHAQKDELIVVLWDQGQSLTAQLAAMQQSIKELQARLSLSSKNSSKPPSTDGLAKPAPKSLRGKSGKTSGGQPGHTGATLRQSDHVDEVITHKSASVCSACQLELTDFEVVEKRQVFELPELRAKVTEHILMRAHCSCGAVHTGIWPEGINAPVQYGPRAKAVAVNLNQSHIVPMARTCEFMQDTFGLSLSQASLQSFSQQAAMCLEPTVAAIGQAVQRAPVVHADETGIRVQDKLHWLHCAVTKTLTWLGHHPKRGGEAFSSLGILAEVKGVLVHDGLVGYKQLECLHALCNAHHLRELVFVHEQEGIFDSWAQEMMDLLLQANGEVKALGTPLTPERQIWFMDQWALLLQRGERFNPPERHTGAPTGKRGRHKQSKAFNLLMRLRNYKDDVWRFMTDVGVPFTNNLAEQALRMAKVRQKVSGCFRTAEGAKTFFTIRSYLATMRKQKAGLFDCLVSVFQGQPIQPQLA